MKPTHLLVLVAVIGVAGCAGVLPGNGDDVRAGTLVVSEAEGEIPARLIVNASHPQVRRSSLLRDALQRAGQNTVFLPLSEREFERVTQHLDRLPTASGSTVNFGHYIKYNGTVDRVYVRQPG